MASPLVPNVPPIKQPEFTAEQMIDAIKSARGLITVAAARLGCSPKTVHRYIDKYPTVAAAKKEAREGILDMTEARLYHAANDGEQWAVTFLLKNLGKDRGYVERSQIDHTITAQTAAQLSDDELDAELKKRGAL